MVKSQPDYWCLLSPSSRLSSPPLGPCHAGRLPCSGVPPRLAIAGSILRRAAFLLWFFVDGNNQSPSIWDGFPTLFRGFPTFFHCFPTIFPRKSVLLVKIEGPGAGKPIENNLFLKGFVQTPLFITQRANGGFSMSQPVKLPEGTQKIGSILGVDGPTETGFRNEPTFLLGSNHSYNLSGYMYSRIH